MEFLSSPINIGRPVGPLAKVGDRVVVNGTTMGVVEEVSLDTISGLSIKIAGYAYTAGQSDIRFNCSNKRAHYREAKSHNPRQVEDIDGFYKWQGYRHHNLLSGKCRQLSKSASILQKLFG